MKNDAKLGMLVGVLGVIVAAVLFANTPQPSAQSRPGTDAKTKDATTPTATAVPPPLPEANTAALPSTPVVRTRKEPDAQPASRSGTTDEEP